MNKRQAIAYAQVALDYMQSEQYSGEITPDTLGIEMKSCFKVYCNNIIENIAKSQEFARRELKDIQKGCDDSGK